MLKTKWICRWMVVWRLQSVLQIWVASTWWLQFRSASNNDLASFLEQWFHFAWWNWWHSTNKAASWNILRYWPNHRVSNISPHKKSGNYLFALFCDSFYKLMLVTTHIHNWTHVLRTLKPICTCGSNYRKVIGFYGFQSLHMSIFKKQYLAYADFRQTQKTCEPRTRCT